MYKKTAFMALVLGLSVSHSAFSVSPSSLKLKIYKVAVSTSHLCTNLTTVIDNGTGVSYVEFSGSPDLGSSDSLADGTYPYIVIEFSDQILFTPESTTGSCTGGTEYTLDVCSAGFGGQFQLIDGTTGTCAAGDQTVAMYLSTGSTITAGGTGNAFLPPQSSSDGSRGFNLGNALVKSGDVIGQFVVNFRDKINGGGASCDVNPPTFSFSTL